MSRKEAQALCERHDCLKAANITAAYIEDIAYMFGRLGKHLPDPATAMLRHHRVGERYEGGVMKQAPSHNTICMFAHLWVTNARSAFNFVMADTPAAHPLD